MTLTQLVKLAEISPRETLPMVSHTLAQLSVDNRYEDIRELIALLADYPRGDEWSDGYVSSLLEMGQSLDLLLQTQREVEAGLSPPL